MEGLESVCVVSGRSLEGVWNESGGLLDVFLIKLKFNLNRILASTILQVGPQTLLGILLRSKLKLILGTRVWPCSVLLVCFLCLSDEKDMFGERFPKHPLAQQHYNWSFA